MKKSKMKRRIAALGAMLLMAITLAFSASAYDFTDISLPLWRNPVNIYTGTPGINSKYGLVRYSMLSANSPVYCGVRDVNTQKTLGEIIVSTATANFSRIDYPTTVASATKLLFYAGNDNAFVSQYVSGKILL